MPEPSVSVSFYGGAGTVTGANFLLRGEQTSLIVDCGLMQGSRFAESANHEPFMFAPSEIPYLLVTHAHIDHIGRIPKLVRDGFRGKIVSTPETKELAALMLQDALSLLRDERGKDEEMLYDEKDIARSLSLWNTFTYHTPLQVGEFEAVFKDAGHILGSAMCEMTRTTEETRNAANTEPKRKIVFTGDLGNSPSPLLRDTEAITDATYLVMESVYGDRNHEDTASRKERFAAVLRLAAKRGGALLIPCFSLEKTQVLLHEMNDLLLAGKIPQLPVFLDSPLSIRVTEVYRAHTEGFNDATKREIAAGDDIFNFPRLKLTKDARASGAIAAAPNPKIIIAGSGMSAGGRIVEHEKRYLSDPRSTILFVGYQAVGSPGRLIQEGVREITLGNERMSVRARVETISGYSSHKDSEHLQEFAARAAEGGTLEKVFLVMGEPKASFFLAQRIRDYVGVEAVVPQLGDTVKIGL